VPSSKCCIILKLESKIFRKAAHGKMAQQ